MIITTIVTLTKLCKTDLQRQVNRYIKDYKCEAVGESYIDQYGFHNQNILFNEQVTVFLDFDGVLLPETEQASSYALELFEKGEITKVKFDKASCENLISVLDETGAILKVHTRWRRRGISSEQFEEILLNNGFRKEHFHKEIKCRYRAMFSSVWEDIYSSMESVFSYAIVDDRESSIDWQRVKQVRTTPSVGFTNADAENLTNILASETSKKLEDFD
ncbi:HAD domain-containing protein [Vibrio sp. D431a]|uniref:HAD domain-containing protein n=1 Tax=Vibrio sp. D431a TaxID=2837388 RepID=UPI002554739A|nr:HAD domain-containing protein [Vibrio sp. D431a]MDK9793238.1 hypothetical protein [Vibrio sp. D431a]